MVAKSNVLIVTHARNQTDSIASAFERYGYRCLTTTSMRNAIRIIQREDIDIIIVEHSEDKIDGAKLLEAAKYKSPSIEVILVVGLGFSKAAVNALQQGAFAYLTRPVNVEELHAIVEKAVVKQQLARENIDLRKQLDQKFGFDGITGNSPQMLRIFEKVRQIADSDATVLITGESGTGKGLIARSIHRNSRRKEYPFVTLNCAALGEGVLESELFGHVKGAFTGAIADRKGRFEYACRGTLFLDEVSDIPLQTQAKLLRVIEEREIIPVGSNEPVKVNVRLISATNRDIGKLVKEKTFREDLYFRLRVVEIFVPPLRERYGDIALLISAFLNELSAEHNRKPPRLTKEALRILSSYQWHGNVRELRNCLESMLVVSHK
ncbi:MAG: sigma-54 dependent transcriptional regulator, partial [Planctomycetota bacterium]